MSVSIEAPIQIEKVTLKKVEFDQETFKKLEAYAEAFTAVHGSAIEIEALIPLLVEFAFEKDAKFKKYLKEQGSGSPSGRSPGKS